LASTVKLDVPEDDALTELDIIDGEVMRDAESLPHAAAINASETRNPDASLLESW